MRHALLSRPALIIGLGFLYYLLARFGLSMAFSSDQVTVVWPPSGLALGSLLLFGPALWPGITIGAFFANFETGVPAIPALVIALGNTLEALGAVWFLRRLPDFDCSLRRIRDTVGFVALGAILATALSATVGVSTLCFSGLEPWSRFWALWGWWWLGDTVGALIVGPLILTWGTSFKHGFQRLQRRWLEIAIVLTALLTVSMIVFAGGLGRWISHHPLEYTLFPFVIWAALRFGQRGTAVVTFIASVIAIWGTLHGYGPFSGKNLHDSLVLLQSYMAIVAATGLLLSAAISERAADRRQVEEALRDADRRKTEFLAVLAHELRNPLAPIRNALEIFSLLDPGSPEFSRTRQMLDRQVRQIVRLVDDLLDVSRITRGTLELRRERVEISAVILSAQETSKPLIEGGGHSIHISLPRDRKLWVDGDFTRLAQILSNLLNNAAAYTEKGGHIWLSAREAGDNVEIQVKDDGLGIPPEKLANIFDMFTQADRSAERRKGGLGIGLSLVKKLVEMHGGTVVARSEGPGKGSEFTVKLPLAVPVPEREPVPLPDPRVPGESHRILVVDDNQDSADSLGMILRRRGNDVRMSYSGPDALNAAKDFFPHAVLLDIGMPDMNGYDVAREMRKDPLLKSVLLVAQTGWGQQEDLRRAADAGFDYHLVKPIDPQKIQELLLFLKSRQQPDAKAP